MSVGQTKSLHSTIFKSRIGCRNVFEVPPSDQSRYGSKRWNCVGPGSGEPVGWPAIFTSNHTLQPTNRNSGILAGFGVRRENRFHACLKRRKNQGLIKVSSTSRGFVSSGNKGLAVLGPCFAPFIGRCPQFQKRYPASTHTVGGLAGFGSVSFGLPR